MTTSPASASKRGNHPDEAGAAGVGKRLIEARAERDLTRPALAKLAKVPYPTLAGLENGDQSTSTRIPDLASALGVTAIWLATGKEPKYPDRDEPNTAADHQSGAKVDPVLLGRVHALLSSDHPYDLSSEDDAILFAAAYDWVAEHEGPDAPGSFGKFLRWAAVRNLSPAPQGRTSAKGNASMSAWRQSLEQFGSEDDDLTQKKG